MKIQEIIPYDTKSGMGDFVIDNALVQYYHTKDGGVRFNLNGQGYFLTAKKCK